MVQTRAGAQGRGCTKGTFRFFDLPPELRIYIYELVLFGRDIHVKHWGRPLLVGCRALKTNEECAADQEAETQDPEPKCRAFDQRHFWCNGAPFAPNELSVLMVCKQIHKEAHLVHIQNSTFTLQSPNRIRDLCQALTPEQQQAVTTVKIIQVHGRRTWQDQQSPSLVAPFRGLKCLKIYVEIYYQDLAPEYPLNLAETANQDLIFRALDIFRALPLRVVEVSIRNEAPEVAARYGFDEPTELPEANQQQWEARLKQQLLATKPATES